MAIYGSPLKWIVMLAPLGMVFWLSARVNKMEATTARGLFFTFAAVMGVSLSSILLVYTGASIVRVFFITAGTFGATSYIDMFVQVQLASDDYGYNHAR